MTPGDSQGSCGTIKDARRQSGTLEDSQRIFSVPILTFGLVSSHWECRLSSLLGLNHDVNLVASLNISRIEAVKNL